MGFIRRYQYFPGSEQIMEIEGVIIVDSPPAGGVQGVSSGTVALVAEFPDMTYATLVKSDGSVSARYRPQLVLSGKDLVDKFGSFDETLGKFGGTCGNGWVELRNKKFTRLVVVPVNLASDKGVRLFRELPTNKSATDPSPIVPLSAGLVGAGREFKSGANRARTASRVVFSASAPLEKGAAGSVTNAAAAATQVLTDATKDFVAAGVVKGDAVVIGVIGGAGATGSNAGTYRVVSLTATELTLQRQDGTSFNFATDAATVYRVHPGADADSGAGYQLSEAGGYRVLGRPLDQTIAAATVCSPTITPAAGSATSWDSLSGLKMVTHATGGLTYTAAKQAPNTETNATLESEYEDALASLLSEEAPARDVNIVWLGRKGSAYTSALRSHCLLKSESGRGRIGVTSPPLDMGVEAIETSAAIADAWPGVGAYRNERILYGWPGVTTKVKEAVGYTLTGADASSYDDGEIDTTWDGWICAVLSNLAPERNPGQAAPPVPTVLAPVLNLQRGAPTLAINDYKELRSAGVMAPRFDRKFGLQIQSGVTTSLVSGEKNVNRRRFADFVQDSVAERLVGFNKLPLSNDVKDSASAEVFAFLNDLLSPNDAKRQRIKGFQVDDVSGNTAELEALGIWTIIGRVNMLSTADFIVFQTEVGPGVDTSQ